MTFTLVTDTSKKALQKLKNLDRVSGIYYPVLSSKDIRKEKTLILINSEKRIKVMYFAYAVKQGFWVQKIEIGAH